MSAEPINLRQARKARARKNKESLAAENRAKFGRTKSEKASSQAEDDLARRRHAAHKRDDAADEPSQ